MTLYALPKGTELWIVVRINADGTRQTVARFEFEHDANDHRAGLSECAPWGAGIMYKVEREVIC